MYNTITMEPNLISPLAEENKTKHTKFIDTAAYVVGFVGNIAVVPQIIKAWSGPAPGLAILTWILFICFGLVWLTYAIVHKQKPLIFAQIMALTCNIAVVLGWLIHNNVY